MNFVELTEQWHKYIKKEYWPDINGRSEIKDFSQKITDHEKLSNYFNISPALSPDGKYSIPLLDTHSGANELAAKLAATLNSKPVITTQSDTFLGVSPDNPPPGFVLDPDCNYKEFISELLSTFR